MMFLTTHQTRVAARMARTSTTLDRNLDDNSSAATTGMETAIKQLYLTASRT